MVGRVVVQWDKDDCADLGLIKVDLLGLGMLRALEEAIPLIVACLVEADDHVTITHLAKALAVFDGQRSRRGTWSRMPAISRGHSGRITLRTSPSSSCRSSWPGSGSATAPPT